MTLPIIGSHALSGVATDGRGGEGLQHQAPVLALVTSDGNPSSLIEGEPVLQPPVEGVGAREEKPAAASKRPIKLRKKIIRERREGLQAEALLDDGNQDVDGNLDPYLRPHRVARRAVKLLDPKMLLYPFEKQFDLAARGRSSLLQTQGQ